MADNEPERKPCRVCKQPKPQSEYRVSSVNKNSGKVYRHNACTSCLNARKSEQQHERIERTGGPVPHGDRRRWSAEDDEMLREFSGEPIDVIAELLGRTAIAINHRRSRLGMAGS